MNERDLMAGVARLELAGEFAPKARRLARKLAAESGREPGDYVMVLADLTDKEGIRWAREVGGKSREELLALPFRVLIFGVPREDMSRSLAADGHVDEAQQLDELARDRVCVMSVTANGMHAETFAADVHLDEGGN